jgi:hypothetical protein
VCPVGLSGLPDFPVYINFFPSLIERQSSCQVFEKKTKRTSHPAGDYTTKLTQEKKKKTREKGKKA